MDWMDPYADNLRALEEMRVEAFPIDFSRPESVQQDVTEIAPVINQLMELLRNSSNDNTAQEKAVELWWKHWGLQEIANLRKEAALELKLQPFYEKLLKASDEDAREYAFLRIRIRLDSPAFKYVARNTQ